MERRHGPGHLADEHAEAIRRLGHHLFDARQLGARRLQIGDGAVEVDAIDDAGVVLGPDDLEGPLLQRHVLARHFAPALGEPQVHVVQRHLREHRHQRGALVLHARLEIGIGRLLRAPPAAEQIQLPGRIEARRVQIRARARTRLCTRLRTLRTAARGDRGQQRAAGDAPLCPGLAELRLGPA
jgi:hypothetical protein